VKRSKKPKRFRAAVIGCGAIAESCHIPGYLSHPAVSEVILCDTVPRILEEVQGKFRVEKGYTDFDEVLKKEKPDILSICTPNYLHAGMICTAAKKDIHVLCEKPMALKLSDGEKIRKAMTANRIKLMVGFSHRFGVMNLKARSMLEHGRIGRPFSLRIRFGHEGPYPGWGKTGWYNEKNKAGQGVLMDMGVHAIDLARFFMGDIRSVLASTATFFKKTQLDDNALLMVQFEKEAHGYIDVSWTSKAGFNGVEIYGSGGTLIVDYQKGLRFFDGESAKWKKVVVEEEQGSWKSEVHSFVDCILQDDDPEPGFLEGLAALKIASAAVKSAQSGKWVDVDSSAKPK
jgi:UDP-N-acetylglucosamine 3-dehydrogenase